MLDRPVLSRRIHSLQHDQERLFAIGVESFLEYGKLLKQLLGPRLALSFPSSLGSYSPVSSVESLFSLIFDSESTRCAFM